MSSSFLFFSTNKVVETLFYIRDNINVFSSSFSYINKRINYLSDLLSRNRLLRIYNKLRCVLHHKGYYFYPSSLSILYHTYQGPFRYPVLVILKYSFGIEMPNGKVLDMHDSLLVSEKG